MAKPSKKGKAEKIDEAELKALKKAAKKAAKQAAEAADEQAIKKAKKAAKKLAKAETRAADETAQVEESAKASKPGKSVKASKQSKSDKADKTAKADKAAKRSKPEPAASAPSTDELNEAQDRSEHDYQLVLAAMPRIVELVEQLSAQVRRSAFDAYVTGVLEHGLAAEELPPLQLTIGEVAGGTRSAAPERDADDAGADDAEAPGPRCAAFTETARTPRRGPVHEAPELVREEGTPKAAAFAAAQGRSGMTEPAEAGDGEAAAPRRRRGPGSMPSEKARRPQSRPGATRPLNTAPASAEAAASPGAAGVLPPSERIKLAGAAAAAAKRNRPAAASSAPARRSPAPKALMDLVARTEPRNNDQRNVVIVAHLEKGKKPVDEAAIAAMYEKLGWRVPVNMSTSIRQCVRKGLLEAGELGTVTLADGGRDWLNA